MLFKDVIGQDKVKERLRNIVKDNRLSHALLFHGKEGSGALPLALAFSQYLVCEKLRPVLSPQFSSGGLFVEEIPAELVLPEDACGICPACVKAEALMHPDIHYTFPTIKRDSNDPPPISADWIKEWRSFVKAMPYGNLSDWLQSIKAENKQGNITSRECSEILNTLSLKSHESEYKIQIIWMAEFLEKEGNRLLKLIEEPPVKTLFILIAENLEKILPTIQSRTVLINIPLQDEEVIAAALVQRKGIAEDRARDIAAVVEGNFREALEMVENHETDWQELLREWLNLIYRYKQKPLLGFIDQMSKGGRDYIKQFFRHSLMILDMALQIKVMDPQNLKFREEDRVAAQKLEAMLSLSQMEAIIGELNNAIYYIERNANAKLLFHALSIKLHYIIKKNSLFLVN